VKRASFYDNRDFTLIELMVVIIIIGILSAIAVPQFSKQSDRARAKQAVSQIRYMQNIVEMYYLENNEYPTVDDRDSFKYIGNVLEAGGIRDWGDMEDPWGRPYYYKPADGGYQLWCEGKEADLDDCNDERIDVYEVYATDEKDAAQVTADSDALGYEDDDAEPSCNANND